MQWEWLDAMQKFVTKLVAVLLSISLMPVGLVACCLNNAELKITSQQQGCHHAPSSSHSCCVPTHVVQATAPPSPTTWDRLQSAGLDSINRSQLCAIPYSVATRTIAANLSSTPPGAPDDLIIRLHVFLI